MLQGEPVQSRSLAAALATCIKHQGRGRDPAAATSGGRRFNGTLGDDSCLVQAAYAYALGTMGG
jgi:hypothetical protein